VEEDGAVLTEYEIRRQRNIEEREKLFRWAAWVFFFVMKHVTVQDSVNESYVCIYVYDAVGCVYYMTFSERLSNMK
jgi:hypothetical protein